MGGGTVGIGPTPDPHATGTSPARFREHLEAAEGSHVEYKEAKSSYQFDDLVKYCVAIANEGGGVLIMGVTDRRPREVVGTRAFSEPGRTEAGLYEQLGRRIPIEEYRHEGKRVLIVHIPGRSPGTAWQWKGAYWMRAGDSLIPMSDDRLRQIHDETGMDFSAECCIGATLADIDPMGIDLLRKLWHRKSNKEEILHLTDKQLLLDAELVVDEQVTYAGLILLGKREALGKHLAQAETIFEYRPSEAPGPAAGRHEFRSGCLLVLDKLWSMINLRNDMQHFQQGLFVWDIPTFDERVIREGVLNAVSHRDYRHGGSVFIRQYPRRLEIVSPGGLPQGITKQNILHQQHPRNRRIAEVLARCGLVERSGQGFDLMYRESIRQSKTLPDLSRTDDHSVWLTLSGEVQDPRFLSFLEEIGQEQLATFSTDDFLLMDLVRREERLPDTLKSRVGHLLDLGVIERVGRGRGARLLLLLSQRFYRHVGKAGDYTRLHAQTWAGS